MTFIIKLFRLYEVIYNVFNLLLFSFVLSLSGLSPAFAEPTINQAKVAGFTITANNLTRDYEQGLVTVDGNVQIIYQNQYFKADRVDINLKKKQANFKGHVQIRSPEYEIGGDEISFDYFANQSVIINGYVQSSNVRFQGSFIEQRGPTTFYVVDADYTTCTNCPSSWSFDATQIKAELGGYAFLKNTFLKISDIPILWLPYLVVPLKNERQSGLLFPEIGYIPKRRLVLSQGFFWAMSRSQDMTLTLKNYELGGLKKMVEHRYVADENSFGYLNTSHINDTVFSSEERYNHFLQPEEKDKEFDRWSIQGYNQYSFNSNLMARLKVSLISDLQYPKDFSDEFKNYAESGLENRLNLTQKTDHTVWQIDAIHYKHLLAANPTKPNDDAVQQLPQIKIDSTTKQMGDLPLFYNFKAQYDHFARDRKWDDMSTDSQQRYVTNDTNDPTCDTRLSGLCTPVYDGIYNPDIDQLRTGQRILFRTELATKTYSPFNLFNVSPEISYNEAHYIFPVGENRNNARKYAQFDLNSRSRLYQIYESDDKQNNYKHEFIPELHYTNIPWFEQEAHPFFGNVEDGDFSNTSRSNASNADLNLAQSLQFDYEDRVYDRHLVTLTLLNRVIKKRKADNSYANLLDFRLSQAYDLYQVERGNSQALSDLIGVLNLTIDEYTLTNQFNYYPYLAATNSSTSLSYLNQQQQYFKIGYISKRTEDPKTDDVLLALGFVTKYLNVLSGFVIDTSDNRTNKDTRLKKFSLITQLKPPGECWAINFYREQKVGSEAEWKVGFDFTFDGKPPKVIPPDELNIQ